MDALGGFVRRRDRARQSKARWGVPLLGQKTRQTGQPHQRWRCRRCCIGYSLQSSVCEVGWLVAEGAVACPQALPLRGKPPRAQGIREQGRATGSRSGWPSGRQTLGAYGESQRWRMLAAVATVEEGLGREERKTGTGKRLAGGPREERNGYWGMRGSQARGLGKKSWPGIGLD